MDEQKKVGRKQRPAPDNFLKYMQDLWRVTSIEHKLQDYYNVVMRS